MSKRELEEENTDRPPKRPRAAKVVHIDKPVELIETSRQLQQLLTFQQDDVPQLRHGISSCKAFLDEIVYNAQDDDHQSRLALLKQYLESEKPQNQNDPERPFFAQLWQAWSFANSNNSDHLSSAICSHFALLLKTLSGLVDFREYGRLLCRTVLQLQHLRLIKRCLDAPKHKEFLLSPSLRLLNEVTTFDGGTFAHDVYKHREQTFDQASLRKCLAIIKSASSDEDLQRRPAVRTTTARYILSHLRLQDEGGKIDILKQRPLCQALFSHFRSDPTDVVLDILRTVETQVFKDTELPRLSKASMLSHQHLDRVLELASRAEVAPEVSKEALAWLKSVCSTPSYGILRTSGWYPQGTTHIDTQGTFDHGAIDLGLQSLDNWESEEKIQVKNSVLASWIQTLRPNSDLKERELILTCFRSAPELVHVYFKDSTLQMDPKMTNTWIGYASFLFEVVNLPLPVNAGNIDSSNYAALPPQTSIVLNNILPKPLTQKIMSRCLNQNDKLISFFIVRLLVLALDKIGELRKEYEAAAQRSPHLGLWQEAGKLLEDVYIHTLPPYKDVINLYRRLGNDSSHQLQKEATTKLIRLYLTVFPALTSDESIDVSAALVSVLETLSSQAEGKPIWRALELNDLIVIAQNTSDVRWFQKHGDLTAAPIVDLLKICVTGEDSRLQTLVSDILSGETILSTERGDTSDRAFNALLYSLKDRSDHVWDFLSQCILRATKAPVKYLDDLDSLTRNEGEHHILLVAVLLEQALFVVAKPKDERKEIMKWVNALFKLWTQVSGYSSVSSIKSKIDAVEGWDAKTGAKVKMPDGVAQTDQSSVIQHETTQHADTLSVFLPPPAETTDHPELFRWQKKDLDNALDDHDIDGLILCLCSEHDEIRRQARTQLSNLMAKLLTSDLEEKNQLYIVIGELIETYDRSYRASDSRLPYIVGTFAIDTLRVQSTPTHHMYGKLNQYLMKSPEWRVSKMTSHWLNITTSTMPSEDDSHWPEVQWVLEWLVDGLRTQADLELLRRSGSLERVLLLFVSPGAPDKLVRHRVLELVYRAALINPMTLVTRTGILSWLGMQRGELPAALRLYILQHSDGERLKSWTTIKKIE